MAKIDQASNIFIERSIDPQEVTDDVTGETVDTQGYESVTFVLTTGAYADGQYAILLEDSDTGSGGWTEIPADSGRIINESNFPYSASDTDYTITSDVSEETNFWIGYTGDKRYVRMMIYEDMANNGFGISSICILGNPHSAPTSGVGN